MVRASPKSLGIISSGFMLCLSLSTGTQADEYRKYNPCADIPGKQPNPARCGDKPEKGLHIVTGEVLHMTSAKLLVKQSNGEEVVFRINLSTQIEGHIVPGSHIEASVNEVEGETHALSIRLAQ